MLSFQRWSRYYVMPLPETVGHDVWNLQPGTDYEIRISPDERLGEGRRPAHDDVPHRGCRLGASSPTSRTTVPPMPVADMLDVDFETLTDVSTNPAPYSLLNATGNAPATSVSPLQVLVHRGGQGDGSSTGTPRTRRSSPTGRVTSSPTGSPVRSRPCCG